MSSTTYLSHLIINFICKVNAEEEQALPNRLTCRLFTFKRPFDRCLLIFFSCKTTIATECSAYGMKYSNRATTPRKAQGRLQILGTRISSRRVAPQVLWPLHRFTAKFEMDWSGSSAASAPRNCYVLFCLRFWLSSMSLMLRSLKHNTCHSPI